MPLAGLDAARGEEAGGCPHSPHLTAAPSPRLLAPARPGGAALHRQPAQVSWDVGPQGGRRWGPRLGMNGGSADAAHREQRSVHTKLACHAHPLVCPADAGAALPTSIYLAVGRSPPGCCERLNRSPTRAPSACTSSLRRTAGDSTRVAGRPDGRRFRPVASLDAGVGVAHTCAHAATENRPLAAPMASPAPASLLSLLQGMPAEAREQLHALLGPQVSSPQQEPRSDPRLLPRRRALTRLAPRVARSRLLC